MQRNAAVFAALNLSLISISIFHPDQGQKPHLCGSGSLLPPASFPPWDSLGLACLFAPDAFNQVPSPGFLSLPLCGGHSPSESEGLTDSELRPPVDPQADISSAPLLRYAGTWTEAGAFSLPQVSAPL